MPTEQEIKDYLRDSGDDRFRWEYPLHETEHGWFNFQIEKDQGRDVLFIHQANGEGRKLVNDVRDFARHLKCDRIMFVTRRNGPAFARLIKGKILGTIIEIEV